MPITYNWDRLSLSMGRMIAEFEAVANAAANMPTLEGEVMPTIETPTEVISVATTSRDRAIQVSDMQLESLLLGNLNEELWLEQLNRLRELSGRVEWDVNRGSLTMPSTNPRFANNGTTISFLTVRDANKFLDVVTAGRVQFETEPSFANSHDAEFLFAPTHRLDRAGWAQYCGRTFLYALKEAGVEGEKQDEYVVSLQDLRYHLNSYSTYFNANRREYITQGLRTNAATTAAPVVSPAWTNEQISGFTKFFDRIQSQLIPEENALSQVPILPRGVLASRTFGIEIEAVDLADVNTPQYWSRKGDGSLRSLGVDSMPHKSPRTKPVVASKGKEEKPPEPTSHEVTCALLTENPFDCNCGYWNYLEAKARTFQGNDSITGEIVSPILRSFHSRGLKYLTDQIEFRDTNDSAGIHVHVEARDLTANQVSRVSMIYEVLEPLFEQEYRRGSVRTYCKKMGVAELVNRFNEVRRINNQNRGALMNGTDRYFTVNLNSLSSHGTIEFRAMGPVYNYDHLIRWAYILREIVNISKADVPQSAWTKVRTIKDMIELFAAYGKETPTPEWVSEEKGPKIKPRGRVQRVQADQIVGRLGKENRRFPDKAIAKGSRYPLVNDDYTLVKPRFKGDAETKSSRYAA